ncbi:putative WD repeat-containing protein alr3466 [Nostoc sp, PCC 7120] [Rhizoctonia solani]|uniref:Putative WD repeat-containing protein alr3466 [Nostoc sp, PCC 7120] n=1 Tax=Rhizoctonia solani TaxID=456999 RepID=A0A0K6G3X7_9AGAM|nr:putative WD repeat-containing protein alr3466 [Nostoc sp, PCC 7120] [Rhizoctonia solani]
MPFREKLRQFKDRFKRSSSVPSQSGPGTPSFSLLSNVQTTLAFTLDPSSATHQLSMSQSNASASLVTSTKKATQWAVLEELAGALSPVTEAFGPLRSILDELLGSIRIYEACLMAAKDQREYETLRSDLESILQELKAHFNGPNSPKMTASVENLCKSINDELRSVKALQDESRTRRYLQAGSGPDEVLACYRRVHGYLIRISLNTSLSAQHTMEQKVNDLEEQAKDAKSGLVQSFLSRLSPSLSAYYNSAQAAELKRGECTPGTRIGVLAHMNDWVSMSDPNAGSVYWLNGMAGTGKTTIAYSLCVELESRHQLAASFFCSRLLPECRDVQRIIPSIAYQLAQYSFPFRAALFKVLEQDPDVHARAPSVQFKFLISKPLLEARDTLPPNLAVMIDALDECENKESTRMILNALSNALDHPIKFFVCSRPEPEIREEMMVKMGNNKDSQLVLHELDTSLVQADIEKYIRAALARLELSNSTIDQLVVDAGVLFIYAATAVRYISDKNFGRNPRGRLHTVLNLSSSTPGMKHKNKPIDRLYGAILRAALEDEGIDEVERGEMIQLVHTIVTAEEPLTISVLCSLLKLQDNDRVRAAIRPLWSVLHVTGTDELVTTLHASFPDYIFDIERSGVYHCDKRLQHNTLARLCLDCINMTTPRFNICGLESSFVPDIDLADLDERLQQAISLELLYACQYWSTHVSAASGDQELVVSMQRFMSTQFLLWLEVMNLTGRIHSSSYVMGKADEWITNQEDNQELAELIHDGWCFTTCFASNPVCGSTPHIYISMLPFWPSYCPISRIYKPRHQRLPVAEGTAVDRRQLALLASWSFYDTVQCISFSSDGERVALGVEEDILIVDAHSGRTLLDPLQGHIDRITSLDFSPDVTRVVSGSWDGAFRVWDTETGSNIFGLLEGHSTAIYSIQFSPNGSQIASGSFNSTLCIWDALNGTPILRITPQERMKGAVFSIRYSPDGTRIISSLYSKVFVWDTKTGELILGPLKGHKSQVWSIDYSPNGKHIVTGSADKSIRVWNAADGSVVLGPLIGHDRGVASIRYSPDGRHIASGFDDGSICIWDAQSGQIILGPIEWHTRSVELSYSPDGTRIISCGGGNTVCTWDARGKGNILAQAEGHSRHITAVACSHDGAFIVTASGVVLHVWDVHTGELVFGPLKGHTDTVTSVSCSPAGNCFASGSNDTTILVWDEDGTLRPLEGHTSRVSSVEYAPDGTSIASGSWDCTVRVWDSQSGCMLLEPLEGHANTITSVKYSPTGAFLASSSWDKTIRVWDTQTGATMLKLHHRDIRWTESPDFSPDGKYIVAGVRNGIRLWKAGSGNMMPKGLQVGSGNHTHARWSPDGYHIFSTQGKMIYVWASKSIKRALFPLEGHTDHISSISFAPGSTSLISGSNDGAIRVWDIDDQYCRVPQLVAP